MSLDMRDQPFKPGDWLGDDVEIRRLIGRGGQGFVYEAHHKFLDEPVAVKAIPNALASMRNARERARTEAKILVKILHPNVLRVHTATVTAQGVVCIVMEMLKGRSLRAVLQELNRIGVHEALLIGEQIAAGVQAAHQADTIHRDIKPENVYVEPGNLVKVLDFGIAKIIGVGAVTTQENLVQGTVQYMSPEHLQGRRVTARSDVFALGCVLYELLAGVTPALIGLEAVTLHLVGWNQLMLKPPRLDRVCDSVPSYVGRAIQAMLAKDPGQRPATMAEVADELRALRARYSSSSPRPLRDLWREGAGVAPRLAHRFVPTLATTTTPEPGVQADTPARVRTAAHADGATPPETPDRAHAALRASPPTSGASERTSTPTPVGHSVPPHVTTLPLPSFSGGSPAAVQATEVLADLEAPTRTDPAGIVRRRAQYLANRAPARATAKGAATGVTLRAVSSDGAQRPPPARLRQLLFAVTGGGLVGLVGLLLTTPIRKSSGSTTDASVVASGVLVAPQAPVASTSAGVTRSQESIVPADLLAQSSAPVPTGEVRPGLLQPPASAEGHMTSRVPAPSSSTPRNSPQAALTGAGGQATSSDPALPVRRRELLLPTQRDEPLGRSATAAPASAAASAKPRTRNAKSPAGKLPFSGGDLIF